MLKIEKLLETIASLLLILAGICGLIIGIADFAGWEKILLSTAKEPLSLLLVAVGILSLSLGLERVIRFRRFDQQLEQVNQKLGNIDQKLGQVDNKFDKITNVLSSSIGCTILVGVNDVYGTGIRLCNTAQNQIRTTVVGRSTKAPPEFPEAIAKKLRESKQTGIPIKFEATLIIDPQNLPPNFYDGINGRFKLYEKHKVRDLVSLYLLEAKPPIGFDILIVDRKHVNIGITTLAGVDVLQKALCFENNTAVASEFADWYDQHIIRSAIPYEIWIQNHPPNK